MHRTKSYYHGFFKYGTISKSHPCEADVCRCAVKTIKFYDIHGKRKQVMPICTGDRTFAGQTYYDGLS